MMVEHLPKQMWPSSASRNTSVAAADFDHGGIVRIPHVVKSEAEIKALMKDLLGQVAANPNMQQPRIMPGFLKPVGGLTAGFIGTIAALIGNRLGSMS